MIIPNSKEGEYQELIKHMICLSSVKTFYSMVHKLTIIYQEITILIPAQANVQCYKSHKMTD